MRTGGNAERLSERIEKMMNQTKKHTTSKKLLALLLALIMTVSLLPMSVFAAAVDVPETEPQVTEPVEEDMQEPEVTDVEGEGDADVQNMEGGAAVYADAAQINYVTKTQSVPLKDGTFYRIVHIDCGRKYFSVTDLKKIIDYAAALNYTHVELAFGNDGLRFLLDDMEVTASGVTYASEAVKSAIQAGNKAFYDAGTNELTQTQMNDIISYANGKGIGIIPMFDAPGHLQTVVRAMATLGVATNKYTTPTTSGTSVNYAIDFTDAASVNFVQALMQKYITYFAGKGCTMFNIAADECGFTSMSTTTYTAYANLVNSMAAMVQNAGMTALAFNDGIYHKNLTTSVEFDTNIAVCYWDATSTKYAPAATLAGKGFKIINTHNKWYYVIGASDTGWYGATWSKNNMNGTGASDCIANKCDVTDGGYQTKTGCMNAIWCDTPSKDANMATIEDHIKTLANVEYNKAYFTKVEIPEEVELPAVNDPETNVSVVVKGQEGQSAAVKVEAKDARTEGLPASAEAAVSYEITPSVENTAYTGAGKVTLPVPAEWKDNADRVRGYIVTDGNVKTIQGSYDAATGKYTFDVPHFSEMGLILLVADAAYPEKNITVTVGGTATEKVTGANHAGNYTTGDETIASVTVTGKDETAGSAKYTSTKVSYSTLAGNNSSWTKTQYYYKSGSNYYPVYAYYGGYYTYYYYYGYSITDSATDVIVINYSRWGNNTVTVYTKTDGDPTPASTTITFKGNKVGDTSVIIGGVKYNIHVTKEDLSGVSPLPIQLWITNNTIQVDTTDATKTGSGWGGDASLGTANYVSVSAGKAYGEQGITVVEALGLTEPLARYEWGGTRLITAKDDKPKQELVFWTGRIHNSSASNIQTVWGTDYSNAGDAFNYVRYYGGKWQVSADRVNWTTVTGEGSTGAYSSCTQQLAAYYMTRTEITKEVTTDVADWGKPKDNKNNSEYDSQVSGNFVLLDYAVKYADGKRMPDTFPVLNKTLAYHCDSGPVGTNNGTKYRMLNNFRGIETENFEVYMITVTMTSGSASDSLTATEAKNGYTYDDTTEQIVWAIDEDARAQSGLADYTSISGSSTYSGCKIGGAMDIRGVEIYNKHGALITYYVRAKAAVEDKLIVNYYVQGETTPFYSYEIAVKAGTTFDSRFARTTAPVGLEYNTVENIIEQTETVNWKLQEMPQIKAQYRYSEYDFVDANIDTNDYKTVNLYYTFKAEKTFVVDFGLPLVITPKDINQNLAANGVKITGADIGNVSSYAKITTDDDFNITYTLTKTIDGSDTFSLKYTGTLVKNETTGEVQAGEVKYSITIIPASTVYYEDSFATFNSGAGAAADARWSTDGTEQTANQLLEVLGSKTNLYGYDKAYENCTTFSMGSAHKVTVTANMAKNWANHTDSAWPTATFTFKGTGFDVISLTDNDSGVITCEVKNAKGEKVYSTFINNYYGYKYENGNFTEVASGSDNKLYQLPIIKVSGLKYDTYTVTLTAAYGEYFDKTGDSQYSFWLDAIRVYDPMGKNYAGYNQENEKEGYPQYFELRDALATTETGNYKAVLIEGTVEATQTNYKNFGPNHEVYLAKDQTLAFKLDGDWSKITTVQLGLKAVDGAATYTIGNGEAKTVKTATDMYYDITEAAKSGTILIRNTGNTILSLTNVKVTFTEEATASLAIMSDTAINEAVQMVRAMYAPEEVQPFTPERFEASWNRSSVRAGEKATLTVKTSEDVAAITVDGVTIDTYRTRTQRTGWGWNAKKVTYREFTYTITASETADYEIVAVNAEGTASEAIHAVLTVRAAAQRPGIGGWLNKLFSSWF